MLDCHWLYKNFLSVYCCRSYYNRASFIEFHSALYETYLMVSNTITLPTFSIDKGFVKLKHVLQFRIICIYVFPLLILSWFQIFSLRYCVTNMSIKENICISKHFQWIQFFLRLVHPGVFFIWSIVCLLSLKKLFCSSKKERRAYCCRTSIHACTSHCAHHYCCYISCKLVSKFTFRKVKFAFNFNRR